MAYHVPFIDPRSHYVKLKPEIDQAIIDCLANGDLVNRHQLKDFEQHLAEFVGVRYAVGVNSGYHALLFALLGAGVGPGHEVITVAHTFVATVSAIVHCGAQPVLIDVGPDFNMDVDLIERALTPKTKALLPVHLNGRVCEMDKILALADHRGLAVIEDAAQALGLPWGGNDKYENVNPRATLANIARLVGGSALSSRTTGRDRLLALTTLNVVAGNTDAHAKNFSVLLPELAIVQWKHGMFEGDAGAASPGTTRAPRARLADAYDIVPQVLFTKGESDPLAMRVGGELAPGAITTAHLVREAKSWGMAHPRATSVVETTLAEIVTAVERLGERHGVSASLPAFLLEQSHNLLRGDPACTRPLPPAAISRSSVPRIARTSPNAR